MSIQPHLTRAEPIPFLQSKQRNVFQGVKFCQREITVSYCPLKATQTWAGHHHHRCWYHDTKLATQSPILSSS